MSRTKQFDGHEQAGRRNPGEMTIITAEGHVSAERFGTPTSPFSPMGRREEYHKVMRQVRDQFTTAKDIADPVKALSVLEIAARDVSSHLRMGTSTVPVVAAKSIVKEAAARMTQLEERPDTPNIDRLARRLNYLKESLQKAQRS